MSTTGLTILFQKFKAIAYFDVEIQRFEQYSDTTYADYRSLKVRKNNKTRKLYGNITINKPFDNKFTVSMVTFTKQGGEYRMLPYKLPEKQFCDFFNEDDLFYPELTEYSDFTNPIRCPLPVVSFLSSASTAHIPILCF